MTFRDRGIFSPSMDEFRASLRKEPVYNKWFTFAHELNRFGLDLLRDLGVPSEDSRKVIVCGLFVRAQQSFQVAILLAELGMLSDSRVVLRSAVEWAIALQGVEADNTFVNQLIDSHRLFQRKLARLVLGNPNYRSAHSPEEIKKMEETVNEISSIEASESRKLHDINWGQIAAKYCPDLYDLLYRLLSNDGTHVSLNGIQRFLVFDKSGTLTKVRVGPDICDLVSVLSAACLMMLWASWPFIRVSARLEGEERLRAYIQRFAELPHSEPADVRVEGSY